MKKHFVKLSLSAVIAVSLSSCGPSAVVVKNRPVTPVYVRPVSPGASHVWIDGEWTRRGNQYVYKQGYWIAPQRRNSYYVPGHWVSRRGGWYWVSGHWK